MRRLPLLRTLIGAGLCGALLVNCSAAQDPPEGRAPQTPSNDSTAQGDTGSTDGSQAATSGATSAGSGADGSGGASSASATAAAAGGAASVASTTGPLFVGGVGGTFVGTRDQGGPMDACQGLAIEFTPDIPTVFILVDRSTSMWDNMYWDPLREGVLEVVERLHLDVRFGFGTFTGVGNTCPLDLQHVGVIDRNNYDAIAAFYEPIGHPNAATDTPTPAALQRARELLEEDNLTFPGPKFIMLVTDGNPDYCDNGQVECRADTTVRVLQDAYAEANIRTFVVGLPDPGINQAWLTAFANAGAGQPVSAAQDTEFCNALPAATAAILPNVPADQWPQGTYGDTMGPLTPYTVDPAQRDQLVEEIAGVIAGVKSCVFDLEGELQIVEGREQEGSVVIQTISNPTGSPQPYDPSGVDGWKVNDGTQIELVGSSCDALRDPETIGIQFGFPCEIIIPK